MPPHRRLGLGLLALVLASGFLVAQPPRKEEEEDPKGKEKARPVVPVPVQEPDKKDGPPPPAGVDGDVGSFPEEAKKAGHPDARDLYHRLAIPYDRLTANFKGGTVFRVELLPNRDLPEEEFEVQVLDAALKNSTPHKLRTGSGFTYHPYELIVLEEVGKFLDKNRDRKTPIPETDALDYAARAVASGLRWHLLAVNTNKRVGKPWELVARQLKDRYLELQRERFRLLVEAKNYDKADEVGLKLLTRYPENQEVLKDAYWLQLKRVQQALKAPSDADLVKLRESVLLYERLPGKKDEGLIEGARKRLKDRAKALVAEAHAHDKKKEAAAALGKLRQAELLDPDLPEIARARTALRGKVLYVGVSQLPDLMSPATAATDAERWAVELMFEGLLQAIPDADVIRYRPALAESLPGVIPLARSFTLPRSARWSTDDGAQVDARDVRATLHLLQQPQYRHRWASDGLDVFEGIDRIDDPFRLRLAYRQGVLEPLGRATFKVIPFRYLQEHNQVADQTVAELAFARAPFGSGPFRYEGREREGADRECAVFRANPHYGQRPGKIGLPWIREIRFVVPSPSSLAADVAGGQLHLYPDAPTELIPRFRGEPGLKDVMRVHTTRINRRVHLLAVNHRQPALQNDKLRQGLSAAIDREAILKDEYRAGDPKAHAALTGPFPVRSWATPQAARGAPLYKPGAGGLIAEGLQGRAGVRLRLTFLDDDTKRPGATPKNLPVARAIKAQIERAAAGPGGKPAVEIELVPLAATVFREKVHLEHDYDLALSTFDYRDDLYSLAGLLDPEAAGRDGRNYLGYLAQGTQPQDGDRRLKKLLDEVRQFRDFTKQVKDRTWDIHALFNQRVPFIPLWQLDRYMVTHRDLELHFDDPDAPVTPDRLDPAVVFTGVEMWRLK